MSNSRTFGSYQVIGITTTMLLIIGYWSFWTLSHYLHIIEPEQSHTNYRSKAHIQEPLLIHVTGNQFQWHFRYPGLDGKIGTADDFQSGQQLFVPVNHDIELALTSNDYIYIFSLEKFNRREIAIPQMTYRLTFRAEQTDQLDIKVDPMCGYKPLHDDVMGRLHILEQNQFWKWYQTQ